MNLHDYITGKRKGEEARKIEIEAMSDPFLADAIDGFDSVTGDHGKNISLLQDKIRNRSSKKRKNIVGLRISAAASILIGLLSGYIVLMNHQSNMLSAQVQNDTELIIYLPEEYIEKLRSDITNGTDELKPITEIENLHEVIKPFEPIFVYLPENEVNRPKDNTQILVSPSFPREQNLFASTKKTQTSLLIDNIPHEAITEYTQSESLRVPELTAMAGDNLEKETKTIKGKIVNQQGEPLIGAAIKEKGTNRVAISDYDGNFTLELENKDSELIANYIGFETKGIKNPTQNQKIVMQEDRLALDEVIVTGYGEQKRSAVDVSENKKEKSYSDKTNVKSKPVGGEKEYKKYLKKNFIKPQDSDCNKTSGKIVIEFLIDNGGNPYNFTVIESTCDSYNNTAIELIKNGPKWTLGNKKVRVNVEF